uniref:Uncharacterized protein n=1 Tax=Rhizophora mucronata TaxID=61149 RepID=A0A2P2INX0_RHIMU
MFSHLVLGKTDACNEQKDYTPPLRIEVFSLQIQDID